MRALGLDVGSKTIGVAVSDASRMFASTHSVLRRSGEANDVNAVTALVDSLEVSVVVAGLPLSLDGQAGHRAGRVRRFLEQLSIALSQRPEGRPAVPVLEWDERFSTAAAQRTLREAEASRVAHKRSIDALAAQFILQGWLDGPGKERG